MSMSLWDGQLILLVPLMDSMSWGVAVHQVLIYSYSCSHFSAINPCQMSPQSKIEAAVKRMARTDYRVMRRILAGWYSVQCPPAVWAFQASNWRRLLVMKKVKSELVFVVRHMYIQFEQKNSQQENIKLFAVLSYVNPIRKSNKLCWWQKL